MEVSLHWDCLPKVEEYDYNDSDPVPAKFFKGKMLLNGVPLDNTSDYAAYCNNKEVQERLREMARQNVGREAGVCTKAPRKVRPTHSLCEIGVPTAPSACD